MKKMLIVIGTLLLGVSAMAYADSDAATLNKKMQETLQDAVKTTTAKQAAVPKEISDELFEPAKLEAPKALSKKAEPHFDLVVTKAPANQVLMGIVSGTPYSMVVHPDLKGEITVSLKDVTLFTALNALRDIYGYEYKINDKQIYVEPQTLQTRVFKVNYITGQRKGDSGTKVSSGALSSSTSASSPSGSSGTSNTSSASGSTGSSTTSQQSFASTISTTQNSDFWGDIEEALKTIVGSQDGRNIIFNTQSGLIMVRAMPKELRQIEKFLALMQVNIDRQVVIEAKILKVQLNNGSQRGVNWALFGKTNGNGSFSIGNVSGGTTVTTTGSSTNTLASVAGIIENAASGASAATAIGNSMFAIATQSGQFASLLNFLETQGQVDVLSSPRIATINNQKAVLKVGTDAFYVTNVKTNVTSTATGTVITPEIQLQPYFSGISLDVTPQIDQDDNIVLHVHPLISEITQVNRTVTLSSAGGIYTIPTASSDVSETDSIVRTKDGSVIAIGGLMIEGKTRTNSKVPLLGDIKYVGNLFRQKAEANTKSELVILLKSTVVRGGNDWAQDMLDSQERIDQIRPENF